MIRSDALLDRRALDAARAYLATLPAVAPGALSRISLHWSATAYGWARERAARGEALPYNVVVDRVAPGAEELIAGPSPDVNAREITPEMRMNVDYCASCRGRNSHGMATSIAAMAGATPADFGTAPIDAAQYEFLCAATAALCVKYGVDPTDPQQCYTHAEAALWDGYFGTGDEERWDLAVLEPADVDIATLAELAPKSGDRLRARIAAYAAALAEAP